MRISPRGGLARSRRDVLKIGGAGAIVATLMGCDALSTAPEGNSEGGSSAGTKKGKEAPDLADAVKAGDLPELSERLPAEPLVVEPAEEIGQYGGELKLLALGEGVDVNTTIGYENLLRYKPGSTSLTADNVIPNLAETIEIGAEGAEYTFKLREGMKWSDGTPFTADDIMFWYEDVAMNPDLTPVFPDWLDVGGEQPLVVEKVDDFTVVFRFSQPNGLFVMNMATQRGTGINDHPAHYMKQFHQGYDDTIEQQAKDAGLETWMDFYWSHQRRTEDPERPVIDAWQFTEAVADANRPTAERNPYYWKVDPDGSQLPYIDRVVWDKVQEAEAATLKAANGEYDIIERGIVQLRNKPVFAKNRESAGFEFFETIPQNMNQMILMLNLMHKDPVLKEVFNDINFRIGLSHAMNREEVINAVFQRQGEPWQAAPRPESPYYDEELAKQYTEYDPDLANEYLDKVLPEKDSDGLRLRPDGKPLFFQIDAPNHELDFVDALQLISDQWLEVGVRMEPKNEDTDLFFRRMEDNAHDGAVWEGAGGLGAPMDPFYWVPHNFNTRYAMPWHYWVVNPDDGRAVKPPPETLAQIELYREMFTTQDTDQQVAMMKEIMDNSKDLFYAMGVSLRLREYGLVSNRMRNTPKTSATGWLHAYLMPSNPQQWFVVEE